MKKLKNLKTAVYKWWNGTYNPPPPGSDYVHFHNDHHWTAEIAHTLVNFHKKYWQWLWTTFLGCATLSVSIFQAAGCD